MPRTIVFDLDGTLVDSRADLVAAVAYTLEVLGKPPRPADEIAARIGRGARFLVAQSLPENARTDAEVDRALGIFRGRYAEHLADETRPYPGVPEVLRELSGRARLAVLTNKPGDLARSLLGLLGLTGALDLVLGAGDVAANKPDPAGLLEAFARLGAAPREGWYVGDLPLDVETARAAGGRAAVVTWGFGSAEALGAASPDRILRSVAELATLG